MTTKPRLKLFYSDFWFNFDAENNFFTNILRTRFDVVIDDQPDLLVCSVFGDDWRSFSCKRLFFTGEYFPPQTSFFDFSLSYHQPSDTNYYLPLYRLYSVYDRLLQPRTITEEQWAGKKAIGTVFSNQSCAFRNWIFHKLNHDVGVDSGGKAFNNVGGPVPDKGAFQAAYRFSLACENAQWPGYATEKLVEAYVHGTVPVYWGDPNVGDVFNREALVSLTAKSDYREALGRIRLALEDFEFYRALFEAPAFPGNREPDFLREENIANFLETVAAPVGRRFAKPVSDYAVYRWRTWWRFREWGSARRGWIRLLQNLSWVGYLAQGVKRVIKRMVRG